MSMKCEQFERILEQQEDGALPGPALAHLDDCDACRALSADFGAIRDLAIELSAGTEEPPERVWISLRNQLEAEGLIRDTQETPRFAGSARHGWWAVFQHPAVAGSFLGLVLAVSGALGYLSNAPQTSVQSQITPAQEVSPSLTADNVFKEEILTVGNDSIPGLQREDTAVTQSIRRNLQLVDNLIAICEKSVREQPDNQMARDYLYGAYQQKAELLATAMNRNMTGGLQ
ncbi:MAG TPA: hypothetical protein VNY09_03960 [Candidatus Sulfotelmatobacter sp.]|jgi:hypothetical protein|nr:hypothetical protein [Candidatus Sulfotelmatobacter sp.]